MNREKNENKWREGRLPAEAPLATPYVPFQIENPPKYESATGLVRGTLFPGLEFPFMGMVNKDELPVTPTTELQAMAFAIQELALYLDTHRDDAEALAVYRHYQKKYEEAKTAYTKMCGPMNHYSLAEGPYSWLDDPWPWEYAKNREV